MGDLIVELFIYEKETNELKIELQEKPLEVADVFLSSFIFLVAMFQLDSDGCR